jgi:pyruvate carboxylase
MKISGLLIANRGEIAIRVSRAAVDLGLRSVVVFAADDRDSLHTRMADEAVALPGTGVAAYLDDDAVIEAAKRSGCDAIHPGYGFRAESAAFGRRCAAEGLTFVGPDVAHLELFGDKALARDAAVMAAVPVPRGLGHPVSLQEAHALCASLGVAGAMMIKAVSGGGGRGSRAVTSPDDVEAAYGRCRSEATTAFGNGAVRCRGAHSRRSSRRGPDHRRPPRPRR